MMSSKHSRLIRITLFLCLGIIILSLAACSATPEELQLEIEQIETQYETERVAELNDLLSESSYSGEFINLVLSVSVDMEKEDSALGYYIGKLTENVSVIVCVDDEYDSWSFKEQYDFAYGLYSEIVPIYESNRSDYCFFDYYFKENSTNYGKAYGLEYCTYDRYDSDLSFCVQTTNSKYYCSNVLGGEYFCINEKEYYGSIFEKAYGTYSSNDSSNDSSQDSNTSNVDNNARHTDSEAFSCAKAIVKSKLKSPSTAKFCWITDATITHLGNGEYKVTGWVEAQNSFGATLRQTFVVVYTATESGYKNANATLY